MTFSLLDSPVVIELVSPVRTLWYLAVLHASLCLVKAPKTESYVHIAGNLYAVLTPLKAGATRSTIEDCFADEIKELDLGGKTLMPIASPMHRLISENTPCRNTFVKMLLRLTSQDSQGSSIASIRP